MHCRLTSKGSQPPGYTLIMSSNKHRSDSTTGSQRRPSISAQECAQSLPHRCGFLRKRGRTERLLENLHLSRHINWRQRFVVVKDGCCYCFEDEVAKSPLQTISLEGFYRVFRHKAERAAFVFAVEPADQRKLQVFAASSEEEMKLWMRAFRTAMIEANPSGSVSASGGSHHGAEEDPYREIELPVFDPPEKYAEVHKNGSGSGGFRKDSYDEDDIEEESDVSSDDSDYDKPTDEMKEAFNKPPPKGRRLPPVPGSGSGGGESGGERWSREEQRKKPPLPTPPKPVSNTPPRVAKMPPPNKAIIDPPRTQRVRPLPAEKPVRRLSEKDCLFDQSDREAAIQILKQKEALGTFLIRKSRQGDSKVLAVMTSEGVREYKIFTEAGQVTLDKKSFFNNVDELLEYYVKSPLPNRSQTLGRSFSSS